MPKQSMAIICSACGDDTFVRREPVYDGFQKVGETITCVSCGHEYAGEDEIPFKDASGPKVFSDSDRSKHVDVFRGDEKGRNCRHCDHYTVNPFMQRCGLHGREVEATDVCDQFAPKRDHDDTDDDPLGKLLKKN
jgi:hypothetical protein